MTRALDDPAKLDRFAAIARTALARRQANPIDPQPRIGEFDVIKIRVVDALGFGRGIQPLRVHPATKCQGRACCIHNPSDHHMREWPQTWRDDRHLMERMCPHWVGHPDPDDLNPDGVHGCDGCCSRPNTEAPIGRLIPKPKAGPGRSRDRTPRHPRGSA